MTVGYFLASHMAMGSRVFDPLDLNNSNMGMSGSELSFFRLSREMAKRGHEVHVFSQISREITANGVHYHPLQDFDSGFRPNYVYSWCDPMLMKGFSPSVYRICNQQINDFSYLPPDYDNYVDIWTSPSETHRLSVGLTASDPSKWRIVNNGCDPHPIGKKIRGRVMWSSSPDRGLHWLLSIWPEVRRVVPHAELKIFYSVRKWISNFIYADHNSPAIHSNPMYKRAVYIDACLNRMKDGYGIELVDQVSRDRIELEYSQSEILAYPCDPICFTEGFSVSILDACSFGCVPLITDADALKELYCDHVPYVPSPMSSNVELYKEKLISLLCSPELLSECMVRANNLSRSFTWDNSVKQFLEVLGERGIS